MAQQPTSTSALPPSNGVLTASTARGPAGGNRKKQKRREKNAARQTYDPEPPNESAASAHSGNVPRGQSLVQNPASYHHASQPEFGYDDADYAAQEYDPQGEYYSDEDNDLAAYGDAPQNGMYTDHNGPGMSKRKNKKKRRNTQPSLLSGSDPTSILNTAMSHLPLPTPPPPPMSAAALRSVQRQAKQDRIWNTSTQEERERIKEFWLSLSEEERKSLLKIEKEAVLRKMKEQQKHTCSCTVCGRKRTAIEEELEVLYDAYYEELEQYANHQSGEPGNVMPPMPRSASHMARVHGGSHYPPPLNTSNQHRTSRVHEIIDDEEVSGEDDEEEYSDEDEELYSDEEEYEDEIPQRGIGKEFFNFGNSLTVKGRPHLAEMLTTWLGRLNSDPGGILTVADDLLKNDGKKFIEMMEQLAERRMQREQEAEYAASQPSHTHIPNGQEPPLEEDEYDDEEDEYDSEQEEYDDEEEDEMV